MNTYPSTAAIVRYQKPLESVRKAVELSAGLEKLTSKTTVFIKPNIVFWTKKTVFPKWGVITTSRILEDMVVLLKERGIDNITIGEGTVVMDPKDRETPFHAFKTLGYLKLQERYGVRPLNILQRPFKKVDLGDGIELNFNEDILSSDFVINIPVMKTHNQTVVSLGIKNLKGTIDIPSRKKCHTTGPEKNLNFMVARLADKMPPMFTLIDGIFTNERGPSFDGKIRRSNILVASSNILSADLVGASILGYTPEEVPHLMYAARNHHRPLDLSDITVLGEKIETVASPHEYDFKYMEDEEGIMPGPMAKQGIKGLYYRKYDLSLCTYCSGLNGVILNAIRYAWKGEPFGDVEVLTGKEMKPTMGKKNTILVGQCMQKANKGHPHIQQCISIKGCPPKPASVVKALHKAGIGVDPGLFENIELLPGFFMNRYTDKPEFDEAFFSIE
jgi:uncharacterized protein (DUF362 family)